ncbi:MAG TPA: MarR family transcriptional regulator [Solirubrobacteraceae bacterium]|nr:MarR family transcriptional regulator [Solirubrobacteraceae bacterium]
MRTTIVTPDLASRLRLDISRMARRLRQEAGAELSPSQTAALVTIERHGPLTPSELAERERVRRPTITRVLARLEEAGLVERAADPQDRRCSLVTISGDGRALLEAARARKDAYLSRRIDALDAADRAALERAAAILERMLKEGGE